MFIVLSKTWESKYTTIRSMLTMKNCKLDFIKRMLHLVLRGFVQKSLTKI